MENARARRRGGDPSGADYIHAGAHLADVREALGLTLPEAAAKTHIKEIHLAAIEAVDVSALPPRPYAIGFVKTYAEFLELDAAPIVSRFKEDAGYSARAPVSVEKFEAAETTAGEERNMSLPVFFLVMAFILWCVWQITFTTQVRPTGDGAAPAGALQNLVVADPALLAAPAEIIEARIIEMIDPVYPRRCEASAEAFETIAVTYNITPEGRVVGERVAQSSNACFDDAALNAIRRWRFQPRTVDAAPRPAYDQKYSFVFERPR